jgi:hypothetical protein
MPQLQQEKKTFRGLREHDHSVVSRGTIAPDHAFEISISSTSTTRKTPPPSTPMVQDPEHEPDLLFKAVEGHNNLEIPSDWEDITSFDFGLFPPEIRIQILKEAFREWQKNRRRVRLLLPASPLVSDKVICDQMPRMHPSHPNYTSRGSGFPSEVCPLLYATFETRKIAMDQFESSLNTCSCHYYQCEDCQRIPWFLEFYCSCRTQCQERCQGKTFFTADQIFYIPGFFDLCDRLACRIDWLQVQNDSNAHKEDLSLAWATKLEHVVLEGHHMMGSRGNEIEKILSGFTSLKTLTIVWRFDPISGSGNVPISKYANTDNDNKKAFARTDLLSYLEKANFNQPHSWMNALDGVEIDMIFVPVEVAGGCPLKPEKVNECLQTLERYFTPGS